MCLIAFAWKAHPDVSLAVAANRDEWHERPASPAGWWRDHPDILAGRDLQAGGTWLGVSRNGRFAALTNFRDPSARKSEAPSRGKLIVDFLLGTSSAQQYLHVLRESAMHYQGFNLLVGDGETLFYFSSWQNEMSAVPPGVHALSNHTLNEPWPKVEQSKSALAAALQAEMPEDARRMAFYEFLSNDRRADDAVLPDTGVGLEWERRLSPALIVSDTYGTRCSTVLTISAGGEVCFEERTRDRHGHVTGVSSFNFAR